MARQSPLFKVALISPFFTDRKTRLF